jgi:hypothetical protein
MSPLGTLVVAGAIAVLFAAALRIGFPEPCGRTCGRIREMARGKSRYAWVAAVAGIAANWLYLLLTP